MLYLGYVLLRYVLMYNLKVSSNFHLTFLQLNVIKMFNVQEKLFFYLTLGYFLRAPDNSTFFRFPLKVRVIESRLYSKAENFPGGGVHLDVLSFKDSKLKSSEGTFSEVSVTLDSCSRLK